MKAITEVKGIPQEVWDFAKDVKLTSQTIGQFGVVSTVKQVTERIPHATIPNRTRTVTRSVIVPVWRHKFVQNAMNTSLLDFLLVQLPLHKVVESSENLLVLEREATDSVSYSKFTLTKSVDGKVKVAHDINNLDIIERTLKTSKGDILAAATFEELAEVFSVTENDIKAMDGISYNGEVSQGELLHVFAIPTLEDNVLSTEVYFNGVDFKDYPKPWTRTNGNVETAFNVEFSLYSNTEDNKVGSFVVSNSELSEVAIKEGVESVEEGIITYDPSVSSVVGVRVVFGDPSSLTVLRDLLGDEIFVSLNTGEIASGIGVIRRQ